MLTKRIAITALVAAAAINAPGATATARVPDLRAPDSRPGALPASIQDLRSADAKDAARGIVVSQVRPVDAPAVATDGFPWLESAAAVALLVLAGTGGATGVRTARRRRDQLAPTS